MCSFIQEVPAVVRRSYGLIAAVFKWGCNEIWTVMASGPRISFTRFYLPT